MGLEDSEDSTEDIALTLIEKNLNWKPLRSAVQKDWQARPEMERSERILVALTSLKDKREIMQRPKKLD